MAAELIDVKWFQKTEKEMTLDDVLDDLSQSADFVIYQNKASRIPYTLIYFASIIDPAKLHRVVLTKLNESETKSLEELEGIIPIENLEISSDPIKVQERLMSGYLAVRLNKSQKVLLMDLSLIKSRDLSPPEIEFSVMGPKEGLIEDLQTNMNLIRRRIPHPKLRMKKVTVGTVSKTKIIVTYIEGTASEQNVNTVVQRLEDLDFDLIADSSVIGQMLEDNSLSVFPQMIDTERTDRITGHLNYGAVAILVEGSSNALIGPINFGQLLVSFEDYYLGWNIASFFRIIRMMSILMSIVATPLYVAVLTYHFELFPSKLLATLISSRSDIPFIPVIEVLFLEITIDLLREAGARMPSKVGQTLGIVGGIVIGTAAVEASLTSNILLIIVALSALASFTTPVYRMTNTIRFLRYPLILFAQFLGLIGIALFGLFVMVHLIRLTSLGSPYLAPLYPPRVKDWYDSFFRLPYVLQKKRSHFFRTEKVSRFFDKKEKKPNSLDFDEQ
ncbi:spore germination protein [Guptibacillus algicola]|uniref:spore germination protein n=1 Tax=Guptibacillus algicola TaxID=225844 RepID=UPI001CD6B9E3|nr:spore germination protein [Alkalihalobacillus algicola]MCA0988756.1 spore germination protein [Alkalihalobacillus algicola]